LKAKIDWKSLKYKNWQYLILFSVLILGVLWVLQFVLFSRFYESMKTRELVRLGNHIVEQYDDGNFLQSAVESASEANLQIILFEEAGRVIFSSSGIRTPISSGQLKLKAESLYAILEHFEDGKTRRVSYSIPDTQGKATEIVYIAQVESPLGGWNYIYVSNIVSKIDPTVTVMRTQFLIITGLILLLSLAVAQVLSKWMSRPIVKLTASARRLAEGDFSVRFDDDSFTEIKELSESLNYATQELARTDTYRKELVANISHDLKTPLTIIKFYGEMIRDISGENASKREEHCDIIIRESDWLADLVTEMLELSKLEASTERLELLPVDLSACLQGTLESFSVLAQKEGYVFESEIEPGLVVSCSEPHIRRVFYNLISNAVNYTGEDKQVRIVLRDLNGRIRFAVSDTGAGIPPDKRDSIWERYYKSNEAHRRAVVGTGLGLAIVKNVLTLHGAAYGVDSGEGRGSTFWFELRK